MTLHKSLLGHHGNNLRTDLDGYAATSIRAVQTLRWTERLTREQAQEIAAHNRQVVRDARAALRDASLV